jgi:hypothetical protein
MIDDPKIGDKCIVSGGYNRARQIVTITAISPSGQITCSDKNRYTPSGRRFGSDSWSAIYLHQATPEKIAEVHEEQERYELTQMIRDVERKGLAKIDIAAIRRLSAILKEILG